MPWSARWLKPLCVAGLILLMQGPAMLVQEVAWGRMLVTYTRAGGFMRGVVETFDGRHPCKMCAKADELRKNEGRRDPKEPPREQNPLRFSWGEMQACRWLKVPQDRAIDLSPTIAAEPALSPGRHRDVPVVPPPERA